MATWTLKPTKTRAFVVYSDYDSLDEIQKKITVAGSSQITRSFTDFSDATFNGTTGGTGGVELSLQDKVAAIVLDKSGSMKWNDHDGLRYQIAERLIRRISSTYTGQVQYTVHSFSGKKIHVSFGASLEDPSSAANVVLSRDMLTDEARDLAGYRIVRRIDRLPAGASDGTVVFDGTINKYKDESLVEGTTYYYAIYTYDSGGVFSDPVFLTVTTSAATAPEGVKLFTGEVRKGAGVNRDSDVTGLWPMEEGTGRDVFDFAGNYNLLSTSSEPCWATASEAPFGHTAIRNSGSTTNWSALAGPTTSLYSTATGLTFMAWIRLTNGGNNPVIAGRASSDPFTIVWNWIIYVDLASLTLVCDFGDAGAAAGSVLTPDEWQHIAMTYDKDTGIVRFFLNGTPSGGSWVDPALMLETPLDLWLAYDAIMAGDGFSGYIKSVAIYPLVKSDAFIAAEAARLPMENEDNGDRLVVLRATVPVDADYIGGTIKIIKNLKHVPTNEQDGTIVYYSTATAGELVVTDPDDLTAGSMVHYRIFTEKAGVVSTTDDSASVSLLIPPLSEEAAERLGQPSPDLPAPVVTVEEGNKKVSLKWTAAADPRITRVRVYVGNDSYPNEEVIREEGSLVYDGVASDTGFVDRDVPNGIARYYSVVFVDCFGRKSASVNVAATPIYTEASPTIPRLTVSGLKYEQEDGNALILSWDDLFARRTVEAYLDQDVVLFAKVTDEFGVPVEKLNATLVCDGIVTMDQRNANDVFVGEIDAPSPSESSLYKAIVSSVDNGVVKGVIRVTRDSGLLRNVSTLTLQVRLKVFVPDISSELDQYGNYSSNVFEYLSEPVTVILRNPFLLTITNKNNSQVEQICRTAVSPISGKPVIIRKKTDGAYLLTKNPFVLRVFLSYEGAASRVRRIDAAVYGVSYDSCGNSLPVVTDRLASYEFDPESLSIKTDTIDELNEDGERTGNQIAVAYTDLTLATPRTTEKVFVYIKASYNQFVHVNRYLVSFESPLRLELVPRVPVSNGIDVAEQKAQVYLLDPDRPTDVSKRRIPIDGTLVKWELVKGDSLDRPFYCTEGVDGHGEIFSETAYGVARNVFFGPVGELHPKSYSNGKAVFDSYTLKATVSYDGLMASDAVTLQLLPLVEQKNFVAAGKILMEFADAKQKVYADGASYAKLIIYHDPATAVSKYADCLKTFCAENSRALYQLPSGQMVRIDAYDENVEVIWGNVVEYLDPYTGLPRIDVSQATVSVGFGYVPLDEGDFTTVYLRCTSDVSTQRVIGKATLPSIMSDCANPDSVPVYAKEIRITGQATMGIDNKFVNLFGGGDTDEGVPPTVLVPVEPLEIMLVDKRVSGVPVQNLKIDGVSENELVFDISYAGIPVVEGTEVSTTVVNEYQDLVKIKGATASVTKVDASISPDERSYVSVTLQAIPKEKSFKAKVYVTVQYLGRTQTICLFAEHDAEQTKNDPALLFPTVFSGRVTRYNLSLGGTPVERTSSPNPRAYFCTTTVAKKFYLFGGADGNRILDLVEEYDPTLDLWNTKKPMPTARMHAMCAVLGAYIYVVGGIVVENGVLTVSRAVERYNPATDEWEIVESLPEIDVNAADLLSYGVACGAMVSDGANIYVFSGIRQISEDGASVTYNDRFLTLDGLSWTYTDPLPYDTVDYRRISPIYRWYAGRLLVYGGAFQRDDLTVEFPTRGVAYSTNTNQLESGDNMTLDAFPQRYAAAQVRSGVSLYFAGGVGKDSRFSAQFQVHSTLSWSVDGYDNLPHAVNGAGMGVVIISGNTYAYIMGGCESGKGKGFVRLDMQPSTSSMLLDGGKLEVKISLYNEASIPVTDAVQIRMSGYIQFADVADDEAHILNSSLTNQIVLFESRTVTATDGVAVAKLSPRGDDIISGLVEKLTYSGDGKQPRYKIVLQATVVSGGAWYGQTFVGVVDSTANAAIRTTNCYNLFGNVPVEAARGNGLAFITSPLTQEEAPVLSVVSGDPALPVIDNLTDGVVSDTTAIAAIQQAAAEPDQGPSPVFDALMDVANTLSSPSVDSKGKVVYVFSDRNANCSTYTAKQAGDAIKSLSPAPTPLIFADFAVATEATLPTSSAGDDELERLTIETGGAGVTISFENMVDESVYLLSGVVKGAFGYGTCSKIIDLGAVVNVQNIASLFTLPPNTDAGWKVSTSEDGHYYEYQSPMLTADATVSFDSMMARYLRFEFSLYSGLSISNDPSYENIPTPASPAIDAVQVSYIPAKVDYLYLNPTSLSAQPSQVVVSTATDDGDTLKTVEVSAACGESYCWDAFSAQLIQPAVGGGKIVSPSAFTENPLLLTSLNGFVFTIAYGSWPIDASVRVLDSSKATVDPSEYKLLPDKGQVIFSTKKASPCYLVFSDVPKVQIAAKITNFTTDSIGVYGLGYGYVLKR